MPPALLLAAVFTFTTDPPDNPVLAAARKRQEAIKSIEFLCTVTEVKEPFSDYDRKTPEVRTVSRWTERIVFDGNRSKTEVRRFFFGPTE